MPDLFTIRAVLGELAGYDALPVRLTVSEDGDAVDLTGSPTQLMAKLEDYSRHAQVVSFGFVVSDAND